ncbi:MAG: DUF4329 domain-containing protein [Algibacter sp.]
MEPKTSINKRGYIYITFFICSLSYSQSFTTHSTIKEAAENFAQNYNQDSIDNNQEIGANIYQDTNGDYYYGQTYNDGGAATVTIPSNPNAIADIHTHGAYDPDYYNNTFSRGDLRDNINKGIDGFVVGSGGQLDYFDYDPTADYSDADDWESPYDFDDLIDDDISDEDIPYDSNDPDAPECTEYDECDD